MNSILQACKWFIGGGNRVRVQQGWELVASASAGAVCRPARCIIPTYIASRCAVRCSGGAVTPSPRTTCGPVATCGDGGGGGYRTTMLILHPLTGPTRLSGAVTADMMTVICGVQRSDR